MAKFYRAPNGDLIEIRTIVEATTYPRPGLVCIVFAGGGSRGIIFATEDERLRILADIERYWRISPVNDPHPLARLIRWAMPNMFD